MSKTPRDQIDKASWNLMESIKDAVTANVVAAAPGLDVKGDALQKLLTIAGASVEEGFHRAHRTFSKTVEKALTEAAMPPLDTHAKKNSG